jgi:hypothetical protein
MKYEASQSFHVSDELCERNPAFGADLLSLIQLDSLTKVPGAASSWLA